MASRRTTRVYTYPGKAWMYKLSFWLVVIIGSCMALVGILNAAHIGWSAFRHFANWAEHICLLISLIIPICMSYYVAWHKETIWKVLWVIFVILILVGIVLSGLWW